MPILAFYDRAPTLGAELPVVSSVCWPRLHDHALRFSRSSRRVWANDCRFRCAKGRQGRRWGHGQSDAHFECQQYTCLSRRGYQRAGPRRNRSRKWGGSGHQAAGCQTITGDTIWPVLESSPVTNTAQQEIGLPTKCLPQQPSTSEATYSECTTEYETMVPDNSQMIEGNTLLAHDLGRGVKWQWNTYNTFF